MKIFFMLLALVSLLACTNLNEPEEIILIGSGILESNTLVRNDDIKYCFRQVGKSVVDFGCCLGDSVKFEATNYCRSNMPGNRNPYYCTLLNMWKIK